MEYQDIVEQLNHLVQEIIDNEAPGPTMVNFAAMLDYRPEHLVEIAGQVGRPPEVVPTIIELIGAHFTILDSDLGHSVAVMYIQGLREEAARRMQLSRGG